MKKIYLIALVVLGISADSFAQKTATASSTATIITPIAISMVSNMNFGKIATDGTDGTVVLNYAGEATPSGGVTMVAGGSPTAAEFKVLGATTHTFTISAPTAITLTDGTNFLEVEDITVDAGAIGTLSAGALTLKMGAKLIVPGSVVPGIYINEGTAGSGLYVTVNYN